MRKKIVVGNWKMNKSLQGGIDLATNIGNLINQSPLNHVELILAAPYIHLSHLNEIIDSTSNMFLGAQNVHQNESGAFTGEISLEMLKSCGVKYVILGHSERREHFYETEELLRQKVDAVLASELTPIFCCGEPLEIREKGRQEDYVKNQLFKSLFHLQPEELQKIIIAYEPIWAIGTGKTASSIQAQEMHSSIRSYLASKYDLIADIIPILYGGSCNPANASELFNCQDVDGGLIGGASLKADDFMEIAKSFPH